MCYTMGMCMYRIYACNGILLIDGMYHTYPYNIMILSPTSIQSIPFVEANLTYQRYICWCHHTRGPRDERYLHHSGQIVCNSSQIQMILRNTGLITGYVLGYKRPTDIGTAFRSDKNGYISYYRNIRSRQKL